MVQPYEVITVTILTLQKAKLRPRAAKWLTQVSVLASVLGPDTTTSQGPQEAA